MYQTFRSVINNIINSLDNKEYRPGNSVILETEVEEPYNVMKKPDPEIVNKYLNKRKSPNEQLHFYGHGDEKAFSFQDISMLSLSGNKFGGNENEDETNLNFFFGRNRTLKIDGEEAQETVQIDPIVKEKRKVYNIYIYIYNLHRVKQMYGYQEYLRHQTRRSYIRKQLVTLKMQFLVETCDYRLEVNIYKYV